MPVEQQPKSSRTQSERTATTRAKLLDATLESLVELGYARTTTPGIAARAGLSRGAQLHHFPTKESLVVAAVEHLARKREAEIRAELGGHHDRGRALELLADAFDGPLFLAALELWVAARTDPALRAALLPLEREVAEALTALGAELLEVPADAATIELTIELVRGLGMSVLFNSPATAQRRRQRLLAAWREMLEQQ
ncbi:TetR/AcrR family transcriptional regulator [Rhodococcus sp. X156]|uniref:TetR/AcrR family transcriptional regulator n=1 Tax=Rhodococcus sp. X156 TaxID=2499145 RepID=UPI000FD8C74C|nr:TetR/AcrR family transcriptional regulator [Rhodococcus sp. X156]